MPFMTQHWIPLSEHVSNMLKKKNLLLELIYITLYFLSFTLGNDSRESGTRILFAGWNSTILEEKLGYIVIISILATVDERLKKWFHQKGMTMVI